MDTPKIIPVMDEDMWLCGLYFKCPVTNGNSCDCQMYHIRKSMSFHDFKEYLSLLTVDDKRKILCKHLTCSNNKP